MTGFSSLAHTTKQDIFLKELFANYSLHCWCVITIAISDNDGIMYVSISEGSDSTVDWKKDKLYKVSCNFIIRLCNILPAIIFTHTPFY